MNEKNYPYIEEKAYIAEEYNEDYKMGKFVGSNDGGLWGCPSEIMYFAPTLDEAQRWLREEKHLHITIFSKSQESWMFRVTRPHQDLKDGLYGEDFETYEDALDAAIKEAFKLI